MRDDPRSIRIARIKVKDNIRRGALDVADLAEDIRAHGLINPILVGRGNGAGYELVAGHRRLAACKLLKMEMIPALVTDGHGSRIDLQLAENIQREDLSPYEIALALRQLRDRCDGIGDIAARVRKSYPWVTMHLDYAMLYEGMQRDGVDEALLARVPMAALLEFKAVPAGERAALLRELVPADPEQRVPSQPQMRRALEAKRTLPREKRKKPVTFEISQHGLVLALEFKTRLDVRRITQLLLERGGRLG